MVINKALVLGEVLKLIQENLPIWRRDAREYGGLSLTVATDENCEAWNYQTGDNSYTGGAYGLPHWAVIEIQPNDTIADIFGAVYDHWGELLETELPAYRIDPLEAGRDHYPYYAIVADASAPRHNSATGYGAKIPTQYRALHNGRFYRVYVHQFSNAGTDYILVNGERQVIDTNW